MTPQTRRPRIALMGEFSAGKSTLCNLLLGQGVLPQKVTATQLPPVWITAGPGEDRRVATDGSEAPVHLDELGQVSVQDTLYIRLHLDTPLLAACDLIDFPGISDPNMDAEVWSRLIDQMDAVIWLTHATQAWRQSEAAAWEMIPEEVQERSLLVISRWDKLTNDTDRSRVLRRVSKETQGLFRAVLPVSLTDALAARQDLEAWAASGADALLQHLTEVAMAPPSSAAQIPAPAPTITPPGEMDSALADFLSAPAPASAATPPAFQSAAPDPAPAKPGDPARVRPSRVRLRGAAKRPAHA